MDATAALAALAAPGISPLVSDHGLDADEVSRSEAYLASPAARASLEHDSYWPKWDAPWWHMVLLFERGQAARIPPEAVAAMVSALDRLPIKIFPIHAHDVPEGLSAQRDSSCHCALGRMTAVLSACGVDVDRELPWVRGWFGRYQMADGGLNCDPDAYLATDEVPSSMVGAVPALEAMLALTQKNPREEDLAVLDRAAAFLVARRLVRGSESVQNASERDAARSWPKLAFPRLYFYDVLRGLSALVAWASFRRRSIPWGAISDVVGGLVARFPQGIVEIERRAFEGTGTRLRSPSGEWTSGHPAPLFPLLVASSRIGAPSPFLTEEWRATREGLLALHRDGLLVDG